MKYYIALFFTVCVALDVFARRARPKYSVNFSDMDGTLLVVFWSVIIGTFVIGAFFIVYKKIRDKKAERALDQYADKQYHDWLRQVSSVQTLPARVVNLALVRGETGYVEMCDVKLIEVRAVRHSVHTGGAYHLGKGLTIGRGYSTSESTDEWRVIATGTLFVTSKRIVFDGDKQDRTIKLKDVMTVKADSRAVEISCSTRQKSMIFAGVNGQIVRDVVKILVSQAMV